MFNYRARLVSVVDGDTLDIDVDLGMEVHTLQRVRLAGLDAPERGTAAGTASTAFVHLWMGENANGGDLNITTVKDRKEKFGRYLAYVHPYTTLGLPVSLNQAMIQAGHATAWDGRGKRP
jgi:micrococcal nuclease